MNKKLGFSALLISAVVYATIGMWTKFLSYSFGNYTQVFIRCFLAVIFLVIWITYKRIKIELPKINKIRLSIYIITTPLSIACFTHAINTIKVANATFYIYVGLYLGTFILGKVLFQEKFGRNKIIATGLAVFGLLWIAYPLNINLFNPGLYLAFTAGVLDSLNMAMCKYFGSFNRAVLLLSQYLAGAIFGLVMTLIIGEQMAGTILPISLIAGVVLGLSQITIGALYLYGLNNFDLNLGTVVISSELFFVIVLNAVFIHEIPIWTEIVGAIFIFLAIVAINFSLNKKKPATS